MAVTTIGMKGPSVSEHQIDPAFEEFLSLNIPAKDKWSYVHADDVVNAYSLGPDSKLQDGVPQGSVHNFHHTDTGVYAGNQRDVSIYVPAQHDTVRPANIIVFLDGQDYLGDKVNAATVLDNLIDRGEIPITVGLFVGPGDRGPDYPVFGGHDNRSIEYDSTDGAFADFLTGEIFPLVDDFASITLDPRGRAICGISSGGNAAFTAAWNRPDQFGNVISHCGSFLNIRGGHNYPSAIRRSPRKPIRVWHQTGERDLDIILGNIIIANQDMASALEYRRYDTNFVFGTGGHSLRHGGAMFPETLRWIWRDHPDVTCGQ